MGRPGIAAVPTARGKRGKGHRMVPFPPLDSPKPSFEPLSEAFAAKRGRRGLGSVRRAGFGTLLCPEFTLRHPPRIPVRGHPVQGGSVSLRKAPLRSKVYPWSSKRPCGPLAFRRATAGSRVLRKVRGVKRGRETMGVPAPFVSAGRPRHPRPPKAATVHAHLERTVASRGKPLYRRNRLPSAEGKERRTLVASGGENQAFFACLRSTADFTISMPIRHTTPISTMVPPGFSPP